MKRLKFKKWLKHHPELEYKEIEALRIYNNLIKQEDKLLERSNDLIKAKLEKR